MQVKQGIMMACMRQGAGLGYAQHLKFVHATHLNRIVWAIWMARTSPYVCTARLYLEP